MPTNPQQPLLGGLARALVQAGRIEEVEASALFAKAIASQTTFISQLVASTSINSAEVAHFAAESFGYPQLDLSAVDETQIQIAEIDQKLVSAHRVIPLHKRGRHLSVAIADPTNLSALDEIRFQTGLTVDPVVVDESQLVALLSKLLGATTAAFNESINDDIDLDFGDEESKDPSADSAAAAEVEDAPIVKFIQKILLDAINDGASDIHFEPYEKSYRIRYRTDGILREVASPPLAIKEKIASRIKVISRLNIAEKRVPQDGRMRLVLSKTRAIDFRVSTLPTMYGEKIVLRILDPSSATLGIEALGYEPEQKAY